MLTECSATPFGHSKMRNMGGWDIEVVTIEASKCMKLIMFGDVMNVLDLGTIRSTIALEFLIFVIVVKCLLPL